MIDIIGFCCKCISYTLSLYMCGHVQRIENAVQNFGEPELINTVRAGAETGGETESTVEELTHELAKFEAWIKVSIACFWNCLHE